MGPIATIGVSVNRQPKAIRSCTWVLAIGSTASCGTPTRAGKNATTYGFPLLGGLPTGTYTVTVTVRFTDGNLRRASITFTLVLSPCYVTNTRTDVRYDGSGPNLQAAVNAAVSGDLLWVQGICIGNFRVSGKELHPLRYPGR